MQKPKLGAVLGLTSAAYFMAVLDALVVVTALPQIGHDLRVGLPTLQWTVNSYGIAVAAGIISAAALGDRFGRRAVFLAGVGVFTAASAGCGLAGSGALLIAARAVQGLGGAAVITLSLTILTDAFPAERRGTVIGLYGGLSGLAVACGPLVGGSVTEGLGWHWIFWINVPIGLLTALGSARLLPESRGPREPIDTRGVALVSAGSVSLVWGLVRSAAAGWGSAEVIGALAAGAGLLAAFVVCEAVVEAPMIPLRLFRNRTFAAGSATLFLMSGSIFAAAFLIIQYVQLARGYSPVMTGVRLLPWLITPMFVSPMAGSLSDRIGPRPLIAAGLALQAAGFGWLATRVGSGVGYGEMAVTLLLAGVGISMALPTAPTAILNAVAPVELGKASGVATTMQRFGAVFAIAIASAVFAGAGGLGSPAAVISGLQPALAVCAGMSLLGALASLALAPGVRPTRSQQPPGPSIAPVLPSKSATR
ncbi:DHA2 family efflux MFS transporter permease subunit [Conexibacter sp. DBS9H8]|uniref:DHA2 family efflux MFS transporter permease subunit n=1 Tax=Conexibacter sp. DBS9H8 TaxID=2937801 RepID=UPI00200BCF3A|nr:DHA2 family efflux MFS transporter permease subunit [Conexibacter sp. DBS9H8]